MADPKIGRPGPANAGDMKVSWLIIIFSYSLYWKEKPSNFIESKLPPTPVNDPKDIAIYPNRLIQHIS